MKSRSTLWLIVALMSSAVLRAEGWSVVGVARGTGESPSCSEPLGPDDGELFALARGGPGEPTGLDATWKEWSINGVVDRYRLDWSQVTGAWQVATVGEPYITITHYPATASAGTHPGAVLFDVGRRFGDDYLGLEVAQPIPAPLVSRGPGVNELAWPRLPIAGSLGACHSVGDEAAAFLVGYNIYRLLRSVVPPAISTPAHYLCGPDLDCASIADNGFVAFVPDDASATNGLMRYRDVGLSTDPALADFEYVIQPVKIGRPTGDADGDGILDEDLDGDGIPEFVDPSGTGRGLTGRIGLAPAFSKPILISRDSADAQDALIFIRKVGSGYDVSWDGPSPASAVATAHDFHAGMLSDLRDPVLFAARDRLACDWPDGPASRPLVDLSLGNARYYLLSTTYPLAVGWLEEFGHDSFGAEHPATTTPPPCR